MSQRGRSTDAWDAQEADRRRRDLAGQLGLDGSELASDVERPLPRPRKKERWGGQSLRLVIMDELPLFDGQNES